MERKDWLFLILNLIIIGMLITNSVVYNYHESIKEQKAAKEKALEERLEECKVIIEAKELIDTINADPELAESLDPKTVQHYQELAALYPEMIKFYRVMNKQGRAELRLAGGIRLFGSPEAYFAALYR